MLECFNETINGKLCLCYNSPRFYQITSNKRTKINISWESMPPDPPISFWGMFLMHKWRICVCMKSGVATYLGGGRKRSMGAWTSGQSECTDITGYNGMDVWSVFCITQWGTWSIRTFILTRLSCLHPLAHLHTFCTQKMHRKITREEILCAAYAQKLGFLVIKLIICWGFLQWPGFFKKMWMNNWSLVSLVIAVLTGWGHINVCRTTKSSSCQSIYKLKHVTKRTFLCWEWARHFSETFSPLLFPH